MMQLLVLKNTQTLIIFIIPGKLNNFDVYILLNHAFSAPPPSRPGLNTTISSPLSQRNIFPIASLTPYQDR